MSALPDTLPPSPDPPVGRRVLVTVLLGAGFFLLAVLFAGGARAGVTAPAPAGPGTVGGDRVAAAKTVAPPRPVQGVPTPAVNGKRDAARSTAHRVLRAAAPPSAPRPRATAPEAPAAAPKPPAVAPKSLAAAPKPSATVRGVADTARAAARPVTRRTATAGAAAGTVVRGAATATARAAGREATRIVRDRPEPLPLPRMSPPAASDLPAGVAPPALRAVPPLAAGRHLPVLPGAVPAPAGPGGTAGSDGRDVPPAGAAPPGGGPLPAGAAPWGPEDPANAGQRDGGESAGLRRGDGPPYGPSRPDPGSRRSAAAAVIGGSAPFPGAGAATPCAAADTPVLRALGPAPPVRAAVPPSRARQVDPPAG